MVTDLIFDVGLHLGQDTAYYLKKGFRVVAVEANPELVRRARERFAGPIAAGLLTIVSGAIADGPGDTVMFFTNPAMTIWGTTSELRAASAGVQRQVVPITVPAIRFEDVLERWGIPYFMKVDIEGADTLCLQALLGIPVAERPVSVSIESDKRDWEKLSAEFALLEQLGFNRFAVVQQAGVGRLQRPIRCLDGSWVMHTFEAHGSGPFGEDLAEPWLDAEQARRRYRRIFRGYRLVDAVRERVSPVAGGDTPDNWPVAPGATLGQASIGLLARRLRGPLLGWYDTHALRTG
jgi:FkbM family methyltransferase